MVVLEVALGVVVLITVILAVIVVVSGVPVLVVVMGRVLVVSCHFSPTPNIMMDAGKADPFSVPVSSQIKIGGWAR